MGVGISIFLVAVGAILTFALERKADGINLDAVGIILMIVGGGGLAVWMLMWSSWAPYPRSRQVTTLVSTPMVSEPDVVVAPVVVQKAP